MAGHIGNTSVLSCQLVLDFVYGIILNVDRADQQIVGDVVQVAAEFQPGPSSTDVVSGALPLHLQQQRNREEGDGEGDRGEGNKLINGYLMLHHL